MGRGALMRLRRADCSKPGLGRRRHGHGFAYFDGAGARITDVGIRERIVALAIPPAWEDVWICEDERGHIQATGYDQRGRKQYLYHPDWRSRRDQRKFDDMVDFARALPGLRDRVAADLAHGALTRPQVLACAVRLLDRGLFRIGSEDYAVTNETYGLATMKKRHVRVDGDTLRFDYPAKHAKRRVSQVVDGEVVDIVRRLKARRGGNDELLAYREGRRWRDIRSPDINEYLQAATGLEVSAKDFRTWGATVLAAVSLAATHEPALTPSRRKRLIGDAIKQVALQLGNTPTVARNSYIDPRVFDRFRDGARIDLRLIDADDAGAAIQGEVEDAVLDLITGKRRSTRVQRGR